jgi:hypothetical protein
MMNQTKSADRWQAMTMIKAVIYFTCTACIVLSASGAQVIISEFMAKNDSTLIDGDGNYSDWIELYNTGDDAVTLTGWYLSDDADDLTQWTFPTKSIAAGEHLVIFASGQDTVGYTDSLGYLHTNFKLGASGESVVLTQSDKVTIEHSFIDYPDQDDDVSYGLAQDSSYSYLIVEEQDATAFVGTSEPSSSWKTASFDDASWSSAQTGVGYDKDSTYEINLDLEEDMFDDSSRPPTIYNSAYIRVEFDVTDASEIEQLALRMKYDDGFVAYLNGTEVASANAPSSLSYASSATAEHEGTSYEDFTILSAGSYLVDGTNVLAIHGLGYPFDPTTSSGEPDFYMMPVLTGITVGDIDTSTTMYFTTPTPEADNVFGILGYVDDTTFSVDRGFFSDAFDVEIACDTADAAIYYTVDGTTPSASNGTLYSAAITIDKTTILRATATKTSYQSSDVDTQTYIFLDDIIAQGTDVSSLEPAFPSGSINGQSFDYGMDTDITQSSTYSGLIEDAMTAIPSISIVTDPDNLFNETSGIYVNADQEGEDWERETSVELINPDGTKGFQINGGLRIRGESSSTSANPKHSFRFLFKSEYGSSQLEYPLFGEDGADSFKRMDLRTGQNFSWAYQTPAYATWLYDIFTRDSHRDMGQPYTRGEFYHLYINGMYWGLYQTEERCDSRYAESYYGDDKDDFDAVKADGDTGDLYAVDGTRDTYEDLWTGITAGVSDNAAYFALQGMDSDGTENSDDTKLLDVDNVIDYMLLIYFTANRDSPIGPPNQNTMPRNLNMIYNNAEPDGFKFVAHDNEHSLEISEGVNHNRFSQSLSSSFDGVDRMTPWWIHLKLMNNEEYALRFADHVHEYFYNDGALTATKTINRLETRKNEIYAAVVAESARWGDSAGTLRTRDDDWLDSVDWLLDSYMPYRSGIVLGQIEDKGWYPSVDAPEFNQHGGSIESGFSLSMSGSETIYYTTDGSDPREVGGAVSETAAAYNSEITLERSTQIKARSLDGETWSALTKATFVLNETSPLRVTEIMYHPSDAATDDETGYTDSDFEFIEILNTSDETVGLAGIEFTQGIYFDFTEGAVTTLDAGEYAILVSNLDAFKARYTNWADIKIAGEYHGKFYIATGSLDNSGEEITLEDGLGNTILDFEYDDSWYEVTDGEGYSLTFIDPTADTSTWSESTSWRASKYTGGTPGEAAEIFPSSNDLVINEALTHQDDDTPGDWVEIYNSSDEAIDINGWFLSDDEEDLEKVELSGLSTIAAGGYLVLTEASNFGITVDSTNGFALSELGESIYLSSGEDGELTGVRIEETFGAAERDVTFGRYLKSDGTSDFTAQSAQTYESENAFPLIGEIVITEIMYHPAETSGYEYIELCNTSSTNVALYDTDYTSNTWQLAGAVEFSFPEDLILSPGEILIISETDETTFRSYYPTLNTDVRVLGPYSGALNNSGEDLYLTRPGDPEDDTGEVPYIVVERVNYDDESPWPLTADGLGASLERVDTASYPNDSINWTVNESPIPGIFDIEIVDADSDDDGMDDTWETEYFGGTDVENGDPEDDWDSDGSSNLDEFTAGTDPTDSDSLFSASISSESESSFNVSWSSVEGKTYSIESCTDLTDDSWEPVIPEIDATPSNNTYNFETTEDKVFYRVIIVE